MSAPRAFADRYVEIVNRGAYHELRDLFADDAVFFAPGNQVFNGRDQIGAFYESFLPSIKPNVRIATYVEQGDDCVYELEARLAGDDEYRLGAIDHATLDGDGRIKRFAVYTK
jgi:ketosteroid isomerase-like protein